MEVKDNDKEAESIDSSKKKDDPLLDRIYFAKYRTIKKLGEGSFGKIYEAEYNNEKFALKFESKIHGQNLLETEATIMSYLKGPNIPFVKSFGYSGNFNILVMQLLGRSLDDLITARKTFSLKTVTMLGMQMLSIMKFIHNRHIIHRDIKPDNFVMGIDANNALLYILDFGLAKKFRSSRTLQHNPLVNKKKLTGTARYASINALEGMEQSRRDDLESVGYVLIYLLKGSLPWQGMKVKSKEDRYKRILDKKRQTTSEELCANFPVEFREFVHYSKNLRYTEDPDYEGIIEKFVVLLTEKMGMEIDYIYDWTTKEDLNLRKKNKEMSTMENCSLVPTSDIKSMSSMYTVSGKKRGKEKEKEKDDILRSSRNTLTVYKSAYIEGGKGDAEEGNNRETEKVESRCCIMM